MIDMERQENYKEMQKIIQRINEWSSWLLLDEAALREKEGIFFSEHDNVHHSAACVAISFIKTLAVLAKQIKTEKVIDICSKLVSMAILVENKKGDVAFDFIEDDRQKLDETIHEARKDARFIVEIIFTDKGVGLNFPAGIVVNEKNPQVSFDQFKKDMLTAIATINQSKTAILKTISDKIAAPKQK